MKFTDAKRIVIKIGTSNLASSSGKFSVRRLETLSHQALQLIQQGKQVVIVSSGAIGLGMETLRLQRRPNSVEKLQACAAVGQGKLIHCFEKYFSSKGKHTAQMLLTRDGLEDRARFLKARNTLEALLKEGIVPIINENDTVATDEIRFGDNDVLSVQVAHLMHADLLLVLSDVDGFFLKDGSRVRRVTSSDEVDKELVKHLKGKGTEKAAGGMKTKLQAAGLAMKLGIPLWMLNGREKNIVEKAVQGEDVGTLFSAGKIRRNARKKWIAFSAARQGRLVVDHGAYKALSDGKRSLLAQGIAKVEGQFKEQDVVELSSEQGRVFGRGLVRYASNEIKTLLGKSKQEIRELRGGKFKEEIINRNNLVIWG